MTEIDDLAAEYALGLLEGEALIAARGRIARDPEFAGRVAFWERQLAPLMDGIGGAEPDPALWERIAAEVERSGPDGEVVTLARRVRFWQRATAGAAVAALGAVILLVLQPAPAPPAPQAPPLAASIPIGDTPLRLAVTYLPASQELLVSASGLTADGAHDHELWLVPEDGALRSLGVVEPGAERRVALDPQTARLIHDGSAMVLTREPIGGKPADAQAGPVVAEGTFAAT